MGEIVAIASQKGGVGKTTTAVNLGAGLSSLGFKTLLIDLDPQGSAAASFGIDTFDITTGFYDLVRDAADIQSCLIPTNLPRFEFIPANIPTLSQDIHSSQLNFTQDALAEKFVRLRERYDYVLLDCPPSFTEITCNALACTDSLIVPIQCEYYALNALGGFLRTMRRLKQQKRFNPRYRGFLLTMSDARNNLSKRVTHRLRQTLRDLVFETVIPRNVRLAEAPYFGRPAIEIDRSSRGAQSYMQLAREILAQDNKLIAMQLETASVPMSHETGQKTF